jgi:hypothetical protein
MRTDGGRPPRSRYWESLAEPHERGFRERLGVEEGTKTSAAMFGSIECGSFGGTLWLKLERMV